MTDLDKAIQLRKWVRTAILNDDIEFVCRLNRAADKVYMKLNAKDRNTYLKWAME